MNSKSAKAKGRRYEDHIVNKIKLSGLDPKAGREIGSGSGNAKGDIRSTIPFLLEAKNQKSIPKGILKMIDQAKDQAREGWKWKHRWGLVFRDPRTPETKSDDYIIIDFDEFIDLLVKIKEPVDLSNPNNKDLKYHLSVLKRAINNIMKHL